MRRLNWLVWSLILAAIFIVCTNSITDADFWWHLKTGEYIWQTKSLPQTDIFSYTGAGREWTVHEWLAQLGFYGAYRLLGFDGPVYLTALMAVITFSVAALLLRVWQVPDLISQTVIFLGAVVGAPFFVPRPQIFYYPLWLCLMLILALDEKKKRVVWFIPLIFLVWANIHASVHLGILLIGLFLGSRLVVGFFLSHQGLRAFLSQHRGLIIASLFGLLLALINPNTYRLHLYMFKVVIPYMTKTTFELTEYQPLLGDPGAWQAWFFLVFYSLVGLSFLIALLRTRQRETVVWALVAFPLIIAGFLVSKFLPIALLVSVPFLGMNLRQIFGLKKESFFSYPVVVVGLAVIFLALALSYHYFLGRPIKEAWKNFPQKATEFVLENKIAPRMYNPYNIGGFLIWRLYPQYRTFIDGRYEMFVPDIIGDFEIIGEGGEGWQEPLNKYGVNFLILSPKDVHPALATSADWVMVYFDNYAVIYVKERPENQKIIEKHGYQVIRPFLPTVQVEKGKEPEAIREYQRSLELNPDNFKAHYDLGVIYINLENYSEAEKHFRRALEIFPQSTRSRYNLAFCLEKQGKKEEAEKEYWEYQFLVK